MLEKHALGLMSVVRKDKIANGECRDYRNWLSINVLQSRHDMVVLPESSQLGDIAADFCRVLGSGLWIGELPRSPLYLY